MSFSTNVLKNLKCDIKIDIQLEGKTITCLFPSQDLSNDDDTNNIISDTACVQAIYGHIVNRLSPKNCTWFTRELHERVSKFFADKIDDHQSGKSQKLHLRGLSYPHCAGFPISILHEFAKSILQKSVLDKHFIFQFSLDKALSAGAELLATVTTAIVGVNHVVWEECLSLGSSTVLKKTEGERSVIYVPKQRDDTSNADTIAADAYYTSKSGTRLPLKTDANDQSTGSRFDSVSIPFVTPDDQKKITKSMPGKSGKPDLLATLSHSIVPVNHPKREDRLSRTSSRIDERSVCYMPKKAESVDGEDNEFTIESTATLVFSDDETLNSRFTDFTTLKVLVDGKDDIDSMATLIFGNDETCYSCFADFIALGKDAFDEHRYERSRYSTSFHETRRYRNDHVFSRCDPILPR